MDLKNLSIGNYWANTHYPYYNTWKSKIEVVYYDGKYWWVPGCDGAVTDFRYISDIYGPINPPPGIDSDGWMKTGWTPEKNKDWNKK